MPVRKQLEKDGKITILTATGRIAEEEVINAVEEFYRQEYTDKLIWDLCGADLTGLSTDQLRRVLAIAQSYGHLRQNGKTALIVGGELAFGLGRMYEILCEVDQHPVPLRVFKTMAEAREWLAS